VQTGGRESVPDKKKWAPISERPLLHAGMKIVAIEYLIDFDTQTLRRGITLLSVTSQKKKILCNRQ
jgi:hypothetical protein